MMVFDLDIENIEYGYRMDGPFAPQEGQRFDRSKILLDPYARAIGGRDVWAAQPNWDDIYPHRAGWCSTISTGTATVLWRRRWKTW